MGFRQQNDSSIQIPRNSEAVFNALVRAGGSVGSIKDQSKLTGTIVVKTPMKLFPPQNPATVRISVVPAGDTATTVSFQSDSVDGTVGFGSAGKAIDQIIKDVEKYL